MKLLLCVIFVLLSGRGLAASGIKMSGYERQSVTIECSHTWAEGNRKYFCKDPCKDEDVLVDSVNPSPERYHLEDKMNNFTVTITDLRKTDSGKYWCAVDRVFDTYTEVVLTVLDAPMSSPPLSTATHTYSSATLNYLGNTSKPSEATYAAAPIATNQSTDSNNNIKTTSWRFYLYVSVGVLLLISLVGILVFLAFVYKDASVKLRCCPGRRKVRPQEQDSPKLKASGSEDSSVVDQSSVSSAHPRPASTHT